MSQSGIHTWDLIYHYHECPSCGFIIESRDDYQYRLGKYVKRLECPKCHAKFTVEKKTKPHFGPLIGKSQPASFDWDAT